MECILLFIPFLFHRISLDGTISTRVYEYGFDEQHDACINWVKLYSPNSFQLLQMTPLILPTMS